jgi:hypothetical protein
MRSGVPNDGNDGVVQEFTLDVLRLTPTGREAFAWAAAHKRNSVLRPPAIFPCMACGKTFGKTFF